MTDYISREMTFDAICRLCNANFEEDPCEPSECEMMSLLHKIPAADVRPVVLCRDCVNYGEMLSGYDHRLICHKFALTTKPNFYCACGERRNFGTDMREES